MSIASEISRLQTAKANIKTSIEGKGVTVPASAKIDAYSALVDSIPTGGGVTIQPLSVTQNGTYTAPSGTAYTPVTVNVPSGVTNLSTGTFTLSSVSATVEITSDFEPDYIIIQGDLTQDATLWGVKILWIVRDDEARMVCDTSQTGLNTSLYGTDAITGLNGSSTTANFPSANYQNGIITVNTHGNRAYTDFCPGVEYRYFLYAS